MAFGKQLLKELRTRKMLILAVLIALTIVVGMVLGTWKGQYIFDSLTLSQIRREVLIIYAALIAVGATLLGALGWQLWRKLKESGQTEDPV